MSGNQSSAKQQDKEIKEIKGDVKERGKRGWNKRCLLWTCSRSTLEDVPVQTSLTRGHMNNIP